MINQADLINTCSWKVIRIRYFGRDSLPHIVTFHNSASQSNNSHWTMFKAYCLKIWMFSFKKMSDRMPSLGWPASWEKAEPRGPAEGKGLLHSLYLEILYSFDPYILEFRVDGRCWASLSETWPCRWYSPKWSDFVLCWHQGICNHRVDWCRCRSSYTRLLPPKGS